MHSNEFEKRPYHAKDVLSHFLPSGKQTLTGEMKMSRRSEFRVRLRMVCLVSKIFLVSKVVFLIFPREKRKKNASQVRKHRETAAQQYFQPTRRKNTSKTRKTVSQTRKTLRKRRKPVFQTRKTPRKRRQKTKQKKTHSIKNKSYLVWETVFLRLQVLF